MYVSGLFSVLYEASSLRRLGKSRLTLVYNFTNHARLFVHSNFGLHPLTLKSD